MKKLSYLIIICLFAVACSSREAEQTPGQEEEQEENVQISLEVSIVPEWDGKRPADSYNYPVVPGMDEWANFQTTEEMLDACQVPKDVLEQMSTQAVVQAILDIPFLLDLFAGWSYQFHFEIMFTDLVHPKANNAYIELSKRNDAGKALLDRLLLTDPLPHRSLHFESQMVELLLSQTNFLSQVKEHADDIVRLALRNDELRRKDKMWDTTDGKTLQRTASENITPMMIGRTMFIAEYAPFLEAANSNILIKIFIDGKYPRGYFAHAPDEVFWVEYGSTPELFPIRPLIFDFSKKFLKPLLSFK